MIRICKRHGEAEHFFRKDKNSYRCRKCTVEDVVKARVRKKEKLLEEFGKKCVHCGYDTCNGALDFHHIDGNTKEFGLSSKMDWSYERLREEAKKCIVLCKNCHAEHHNGVW